jgi:phage tail-like protein
MPTPSDPPFTAFNFIVELTVDGIDGHVCSAAFQECDGLEQSMEVKTIREGGAPVQYRLTGPVAYGQVTLKRGMTTSTDIWEWFESFVADPTLRAEGEVVVLAADRSTPRARFTLSRVVPIKVKAPALNAKDGVVAIEELQLAYDWLALRRSGA